MPQIMPNIHGRIQRIHGFTPAELLMGYNPEWRVPIDRVRSASNEEVIDVTAPQGDLQYWEEKRAEMRDGAALALINRHTRLRAKATAGWTSPTHEFCSLLMM